MIRFLSLLLACFTLAKTEPSCPDLKDLEFLRSLNQERQYPLAAFQAEIFRRSPVCHTMPEIDLELGKALYHLGQFPRVREILKPYLTLPEPLYRRYWAESHLLDMTSGAQLDSLQVFLESGVADSIWEKNEKSILLAAVLYMKGDVSSAKKDWPNNLDGKYAMEACRNPNAASCYLQTGFQNPMAAAGLSLIPGLGYAYGGRIGDGVFALTLVSFFYGVAAYYAFYGSAPRAWTFAGFGSVFYLSSIYGAYHTVERTNKLRRTKFLMALHKQIFN